jgi:hypothetical protein
MASGSERVIGFAGPGVRRREDVGQTSLELIPWTCSQGAKRPQTSSITVRPSTALVGLDSARWPPLSETGKSWRVARVLFRS